MVILVDGSMLEGGGQLLRMAIAYSAVMGKTVKIENIRAGRPKPGLKAQHMAAVRSVAALTSAQVKGLTLGSRTLEFNPGEIGSGSYKVNIGTAGSIGLLLQSLAPAATFTPDKVYVELRGGTSVRWAIPVLALEHVIWKILSKMDFNGHIEVLREGFYPRGGGLVKASFEPVKRLKPLLLVEQGKIEAVRGISLCGRLPSHVSRRQAKSAEEVLKNKGLKNIHIDHVYETGNRTPMSPGSLVILWAETSTGCLIEADSLGAPGKPSEEVGREAAERLLSQLKTGATVDEHTADNLIIWCSLAHGESSFSTSVLTLHTRTAIELAKQITGSKFKFEAPSGRPVKIVCEGVGLKNLFI
ncbi:MAG: RNA 3'-terminal phosphate cyclase [Nitrososphaeria archaeon]|nr:RNA 3'-terminal phosphate cyclase [Nitrososphaeria archaeon]NIN53276.1 RNA 3'-terminal phosphate cyclase [Nitrososphaeria archaeon]NIQ33727.1 RNA 3'-terminal phosphate cyclase [Nitrososphaeria archaeon]